MKGRPTDFWGKLSRDRDASGDVTEWHPLLAHCADVAACTEAVLTHTILGTRLAQLAGRDRLDHSEIARMSAIAALHDIGKFNLGFQRKSNNDRRDTAGHVTEVLALFGSGYEAERGLRAALSDADLENWCPEGGALELLVAAIGHHGRPVRCGQIQPDPSLWTASDTLDPFGGIGRLTHALRSWFPEAFSPSRTDLADAAEFQHGFAGVVMLTDWLGSDRTFFPFAADDSDRMPFARRAARDAVRAIGLDVSAARETLGEARPTFAQISDFPPHEAQAITMELDRPRNGGLTILESETGSGKTEAALGRFIQLFQAGLVDGLMFALPTRTAATQIHRRVVDAIARAFPGELRPGVVLAVPGYLKVDEMQGKRLAGFDVLWNDDPNDRLRHRGWAAEQPKRFLAGSVVIGTIDQVLLSSLRVGHAHLRASALLRHLLVVDEVHASDAYMNRILEEVLRFHLNAGGHAFLMSATLGSHVRRRLEGAAHATTIAENPLSAALATPYPVVHDRARGGNPTTKGVTSPGLSKVIEVSLASLSDDPHGVARRALDCARSGARVLVLRNTVTDAIETQRALEGAVNRDDAALLFRINGIVTLHHARFAKEDRERLDNAIEGRFGKKAPSQGGSIVVATQTVQQSLDLDADILFTDLAPMDVLLQRFGRVHRHPRRNPVRPPGFDVARAVVMVGEAPLEKSLRKNGEASAKHGIGTVYDDVVILEATRRRLAERPVLAIPAQNRELVEVTTHPEALDALAANLGDLWAKHRQTVTGIERAHLGLAALNVVARDQRFGEYSFNSGELSERIAARLGESDRRAVFAERPLGPFGGEIRELTLPGWLTREAPRDPKLAPTDVRAADGPQGASVTFAFGPLRFQYDRLGLRRDDTSTSDASEDIADA